MGRQEYQIDCGRIKPGPAPPTLQLRTDCPKFSPLTRVPRRLVNNHAPTTAPGTISRTRTIHVKKSLVPPSSRRFNGEPQCFCERRKPLPPPGANARFCAFEPDARDPSGCLTDGIVTRRLSFRSSACALPGAPARAWITLLLRAGRVGTSDRHKVSKRPLIHVFFRRAR